MGNQQGAHRHPWSTLQPIITMNPTTKLTLKCELNEDLRRRTLDLADLNLESLRAVVSELFSLNENFKLLWRDDDDDMVTISSDADVEEATRVAASLAKPTLRLRVVVSSATVPQASPEPAPARNSTTSGFGGSRCVFPFPGFDLNHEQIKQQVEQFLPGLEKHAKQMATELNKQVPAVAAELEKHARAFHAQMPAEFKHKADGLCKFLKKPKKNKKLHMKFVADVSLPDRTEVLPGEVISKTWRVVNSGRDEWPLESRLQHVGSDLFEGAQPSAVPCLQPGEETNLSLDNMLTPAEPGRYMSHWRLSTAEGAKYGDRLWFDVTVLDPSGAEAVPPVVHLGICCDATGMNPIVGPRYKKIGHDYDLCQEAFDALSDDEKADFVQIHTPEDAARVAEQEAAEQWFEPELEPQPESVPEPELHPEPVPEPEQDGLPTDEVVAVLDCTDLSESCMADIAESLQQQEAQAAEEEAARIAAEEEAACIAAEEEAARIAAEEEAARIAAEAAAMPSPPTEIPVEWQGGVQSLKDMGFSSFVATNAMSSTNGDVGAALEAALSYEAPTPPAEALVTVEPVTEAADDNWEETWDHVMDELIEMGFECVESNKQAIVTNNGDLKSTVTALVSEERKKRAEQA